MRHTQLFTDLAQVPRDPSFVFCRRSPTDHFQVGDFGQRRENLVLDANCEKRVIRIPAQVFKWQDGDA
jgi:hypothetical protein